MNISFNWNKRQQNQQKKKKKEHPQNESTKCLSLFVLARLCVHDKWSHRENIQHGLLHPVVPIFRVSLPLHHHSTLTLLLNSASFSSAETLLPEPAIPSPSVQPRMKDRPCFFFKKRKLTWACETSHKAEKRPFVIHRALCGFSSPLECFLQKKTENQVPSGGSLCFFLSHNEERKGTNTHRNETNFLI